MTFAVIHHLVLMRLQNNYCSINWGKVVALIMVHLQITANVITDEGI